MAKILIVDDSQDLCEVLTLMVQRKGYNVAAVSCKQDLFNELPFIKPDLILLDVRLGGVDGRTICSQLKANYPYIPVILLSGSPELLKDYIECNADDVIEKPFEMSNLLMKIDTLINKRQSVGR